MIQRLFRTIVTTGLAAAAVFIGTGAFGETTTTCVGPPAHEVCVTTLSVQRAF